MQIQHIRHATIKVKFNNITFLVDPMLSKAEVMEPVTNAANYLRNPLVDLPTSLESIIENIEGILLTHSHRDHWDEAAIQILPKTLLIFCQPADVEKLTASGFTNIIPVKKEVNWRGINIIRTGGTHGKGEMGEKMGPVSGFVLQAENEKALYIVGDSIFCREVENVISVKNPDVIVVNGGAAQFLVGGPITMDEKDIENVCKEAPQSQVLAIHMEAWNHCLLTKKLLKEYSTENNIENLIIPENGDVFEY